MNRKPKILIVDDEYEKVKIIMDLLKGEFDVDFEHVSNSKDAIKKIINVKFDLLIIDIQIPPALGESIDPYGGRQLLEYIDINDDLIRPTHILGLTAHDESYQKSKKIFYDQGWSLICGTENTELIKSIIVAKIRHAVDPPQRYDVAILTALEKTELEAVLNWPCNWIPIREKDDCNIYYAGIITNDDGVIIKLLATSCHYMGIAQAAAVGMKICLKYKPDYIFMTGIAAGIDGKVNIGDILVADICWDWGNGKQTIRNGKPMFLSAPRQLSLDPLLKAKFKKISTSRQYLDDIYNDWPTANRPGTALNVHVGPVATGAVVLEDPSVVEMIQSQHRETIGIEMEAYGLSLAANMSSVSPPKTIIIKSVCDFADPEKGNEWQAYAAYTSSQLALKFIVNDLYEREIVTCIECYT